MNTAASWLRGGIVGLVLVAPATGEPAERVTFDTQVNVRPLASPPRESPSLESPSLELTAELPPVEPIPVPPLDVDPFPGHTYGNLEDVACIVALENRDIPYERYGRHARGVQTPVRLMGALHGVRFQHADQPDWLASARKEIIDCRLLLALDDLADRLARRGFTTVLHYGIYRGDLPLPKDGRPLHHTAGLAIDVASFVREDGTRLEVRRDWRGRVGERTCDEGEWAPGSERAEELHGILCELAKDKLFHQVLTPNHDVRHRDHFHLEVMRETEWTMVE